MGIVSARFLAFAIGLFTVGAQAALLREYLVLFRGSELALGFLFSFWFLWVALAAGAVRRSLRLAGWVRRRLVPLASVQPLGGFVGLLLVAGLRLAADVPAWAPLPPLLLALGAAGVTAPVGLLTGVVFPAACDAAGASPVEGARFAYVWESVGAVVGGLAATTGFRLGLDAPTVVAALGAVQCAAAASHGRIAGGAARFAAWAMLAACVALVTPPVGPRVRDGLRELALRSSLPGATRIADRETPYHRITTARLATQTVVLLDGEVLAAFPEGPEHAAEAAVLASQPGERRRALVLGHGRVGTAFALARYFPEVVVVTLDPAVVDAVIHARTPAHGPVPGNLRFIEADPRVFVAHGAPLATPDWDLVVIAAPEPATRAAGRLYSREFLEAVARRLARDGVLAAFVRSGENALVGETLRYGQSVWQTFSAVFSDVQVVPGEAAILLASTSPGVTAVDPAILATRHAGFAGADPPFDPRRFPDLVREDRARFIRESYAEGAKEGRLIHTDGRPLTAFLAMLAALQQGGHRGTGLLWALFEAGPALAGLLLLVLLYGVIRSRFRASPEAAPGEAGARILVGATGGASIAATIVLMAQYQSVIGAVHGDVGAATAVVMLGVAAGARLGAAGGARRDVLRAVVVALSGAAILACVPLLVPAAGDTSRGFAMVRFALLFGAVGVVTGAAWPVAAGLAGSRAVAATLETWDHRGASLFAGLTGVVLLPLFGTTWTCLALAGLMGIAAVAVVLDAGLRGDRARRWTATRMGRFLTFFVWPRSFAWPTIGLAVAVLAVAVPLLGNREDPALSAVLSEEAIRRLDPSQKVVAGSEPFLHHRLEGVRDPEGDAVAVATMAVAPDIRGWGGAFNLALSVGVDGRVRRVRVMSHRETPAYVPDLAAFLGRFEGTSVGELAAATSPGVDAITGATVTSEAMSAAIRTTATAVGRDLLAMRLPAAPPVPSLGSRLTDPRVAWVLLVLAGAVAVHRRGPQRVRMGFLAIVLVGSAFFDVQLSASWLQSLARMEPPSPVANPALWLLTFGVLGLAVLQGPVYCAHACPFGAAQEWIGRLGVFAGWRRTPPPAPRDRFRAAKYALLVLVAVTPLFPDAAGALGWDPLAAVFASRPPGLGLAVVGIVAVASLAWFRPWCRFLCPVGAFLNLFNGLAGRLGAQPSRNYGACDLGVRGPDDIDCLQCNRCTRSAGKAASSPATARAWIGFVVLMIGLLLVVAWGFVQGVSPDTAAMGARPGVRRIDVERVLRQIDEGRLSDHEALYWVPAP